MIYEEWQFHDINPIYQQLAQKLLYSILGGKISAGEALPSVRKMAKVLHINANTVLRSYKIISQEELIITSKGGKYAVTQDYKYIQHKKQETVKILCCSYLSKMFA